MSEGREHLSLATLARVAPGVRRPGFDPARLRPGIVHLGCGAFHRAHQAWATQRAIEAEPGAWGIVAASLRSPGVCEALSAQDGLYTLLERGPNGVRAEIVGTLRTPLFAPADPQALIRHIAAPQTRIVSLTVTEKGYCIDPASARLDPLHPDIRHDVANPDRPRSTLGFLVAGLAAVRKAAGTPPVVLCCDNLAHNGPTLRQAAIDYAALRDDVLARWIETDIRFPATMVDRIVPATTAPDEETAASLLGLADAAPVVAEPFFQWVIEAFDAPRPRWEAAGATVVPDVAPWEAAKLRMLNGTHSALAYLGGLAGLETVADAAGHETLSAFARRLMLAEQAPTLPAGGPDPAGYADTLLARWRNPRLRHRLAQIATDGSRKLPQRLLAPLLANRQAGRPTPCTLLVIAAWMQWASGRDTFGRPVTVDDPLAAQTLAFGQQAGDDPARLVGLFLTLRDVFGPGFTDESLAADLASALARLRSDGPLAAVGRALAG